ncbi:MAG: chromate efflux transporter [Pseudohongiellaceae bacterium]|nr:chromate efflux transporter [Pseudohongiellaceae bacterium]
MTSRLSFRETLWVWWRIGVLSFGGPAGQIALMHRVIVEEKKWLDETRFLHALNYCMLLPGPEAQQLATYVGWLLQGVRGGLLAGLLFIVPGAVAIMLLSCVYVLLGQLAWVDGFFFGMKAAVLAIVIQALLRIASRALDSRFKISLAVAGFLALFVFNLPFPLVVIGAGAIAYLAARFNDAEKVVSETPENMASVLGDTRGSKRAAFICAGLWASSLVLLYGALGNDHVLSQIATFFSKMSVVSFGGAYAVLSYVAQEGVNQYQWLAPGQMLDGLGLAETTPGPLILVTQFVGFLGGWNAGETSSLWLAICGALVTLWVTFVPCFLWIFAGAPYVEKLRENAALSAALAAITAVVVGVIANLALWFALNLLFTETSTVAWGPVNFALPELPTVQLPALALSSLACLMLFVFKLRMLVMLLVCALLGMLWRAFLGM